MHRHKYHERHGEVRAALEERLDGVERGARVSSVEDGLDRRRPRAGRAPPPRTRLRARRTLHATWTKVHYALSNVHSASSPTWPRG